MKNVSFNLQQWLHELPQQRQKKKKKAERKKERNPRNRGKSCV